VAVLTAGSAAALVAVVLAVTATGRPAQGGGPRPHISALSSVPPQPTRPTLTNPGPSSQA